RVPATTVSTIQAALGPGWELVEVAVPTASDSPGAPEAVAAVCGAEIYLGHVVRAGVVEAGLDSLRWAHTVTAGVARSEERRVGKECRLLCRSRWSPYH